MSQETLEEKLKPDWEQWIPVYGIRQMFKDQREGRPSIIETSKYWSEYHSITLTGVISGVIYSLYKLFERIF